MYTTLITLIALRSGFVLPVEISKKIINMSKRGIPEWMKEVTMAPPPPRARIRYEWTIAKTMARGYTAAFEDLLYPGQRMRDTLAETQNSSEVFLDLRCRLLAIKNQWDIFKTASGSEKQNYLKILKGLPDMELILRNVIDRTHDKYCVPVYSKKELEELWPTLYGDGGWVREL